MNDVFASPTNGKSAPVPAAAQSGRNGLLVVLILESAFLLVLFSGYCYWLYQQQIVGALKRYDESRLAIARSQAAVQSAADIDAESAKYESDLAVELAKFSDQNAGLAILKKIGVLSEKNKLPVAMVKVEESVALDLPTQDKQIAQQRLVLKFSGGDYYSFKSFIADLEAESAISPIESAYYDRVENVFKVTTKIYYLK